MEQVQPSVLSLLRKSSPKQAETPAMPRWRTMLVPRTDLSSSTMTGMLRYRIMAPGLTKRTMCMRSLLCLTVVFLVMVAPAQINGGKKSSKESDEAAIRKAWQDYVVAWNKHDTKLLAEFLAEDVDRRTADGRVLSGRPATLAGVERSFGVDKDATLVSVQVDIRFLTHDVAVLDARDELRSTPNTGAPVQTNHTSIFMRQNGRWVTAAIRAWRLTLPSAQ
jgi:uncharacterized protein (TIGR02246 family)